MLKGEKNNNKMKLSNQALALLFKEDDLVHHTKKTSY
jgi:hypothetical protein